jgi:putative flavoprotein involved in K+ transport
VVVATGSFHTPRIPPLAKHISDRVTQIHSHNYWNEVSLPEGAVLIIGSAQTGVQLAEELFEAGRPVYISVGSAGRVPRRYRGRDIFNWICDIFRNGASFGVAMPTVDNLPDASSRLIAMPALSGHKGGHDTNLRQFAADGMTLAGRLTGADGERLTFANDLAASLARTDSFFEEHVRGILDRYIDRAGIEAPPAENRTIRYQPPELTELNLLHAGISTIIWATGYGPDYQWIDAPILDELGFPRNMRGVTEVPGLYFFGLLWQHSQLSASLVGPEFDGPYLLDRMRRAAA